MTVLINRDPFARQELHRRNEYNLSRTCDWCGNVRATRGGRKYLYVYETQPDAGRTHEHAGRFCCKSCHDSYHS